MRLRILYHHRTQGRGAEAVHIASIVHALEAMGHSVTVLSPPGVDPMNPHDSAPVDKTRVKTQGVQSLWKMLSRRLPNFLFELTEVAYNIPAWWRLRKLLRRERFDLIYERYAFYLLAGAWLARRHGIPFVLEANEVSGIAHRARPQSYPRLCAAFERRLFARCTGILAVSSHLKGRILHQGVPDARVRVVPNAFDAGKLSARARQPELRERYRLDGRVVVGFAGWFDRWDRLDILIDVAAELKLEYPQLALLLIGDGPVAPALRAHAAQRGIEGDVVFTGAVPRTEVHDYINLLDIAVLPHSNDFGSPVVMFEFMALRKPIVAPRLEPILDVHRDGVTALLFDPLNAAGLAAAVRRYLRDPTLRQTIADRAYTKLRTEHTWDRNAAAILEAAGIARTTVNADARPAVCLVAELPPPAGGMAVQAERLSERLRAEGHTVFNIPTNALPTTSAWRRFRGLRGLANLACFLYRLRAVGRGDVVHVFSHSYLSFFLFTAPAVAYARARRKPVVLHYHGGAAATFLRRWSKLALPFLRAARAVVVPSVFLAEIFRRHGIDTQEVPNVLDVAAFTFRERRPLTPRILMARHLEPVYNIGCGVRAFAHVAERYPHAHLTIAGDGSERRRLEALCESLGVRARVTFAGRVDHERMRVLYNENDILLNSSRVDNQPVSILEAFASGLPVVTTAVGGIPCMTTHGEDALHAPDGDAELLGRHMLTLLADPETATALVARARQRVQRHGWQRIYPLLAELYRA